MVLPALSNASGKWSSPHGLRILETAFVFAAPEAAGEIAERLRPEFEELGQRRRLDQQELVAGYESVMETILEVQEKGA